MKGVRSVNARFYVPFVAKFMYVNEHVCPFPRSRSSDYLCEICVQFYHPYLPCECEKCGNIQVTHPPHACETLSTREWTTPPVNGNFSSIFKSDIKSYGLKV